MAVTYGFFNSVNGDRKYNAEQMSEYFRGIVNEGVFQHLDGGLAVTAGTGLAVSVASGRAIIQNRWVQNSDAMTLSISAASETYARKDAVVVRLNYSTRSIEIAVKAGTPAASPVAPSMTRNSTTYEMALAYVNVAANATSVTITDKRSDSTVCGWATVAQATSGEVDAQLNAMKTGFDGVEYSSPAAMVQGSDNRVLDFSVNGILGVSESVSDTIAAAGSYYYYKNIMKGQIVNIYNTSEFAATINVGALDGTETVISGGVASGASVRFECPVNAKYIRFYWGGTTVAFTIDIYSSLQYYAERENSYVKGTIIENADFSYKSGNNKYYNCNIKDGAIVTFKNSNTYQCGLNISDGTTEKNYGYIQPDASITFIAPYDIILFRCYQDTGSVDANFKFNITTDNPINNKIDKTFGGDSYSADVTRGSAGSYSVKVNIPKNALVKFSNDSNDNCTVNVQDKDGNETSISGGVIAGTVLTFVAPVDIQTVRCYFASTHVKLTINVLGGNAEGVNSANRFNGYEYSFVTDYEIKSKGEALMQLMDSTGIVDSFLFFTDPHTVDGTMTAEKWKKFETLTQSMKSFYLHSPISSVLCGGDWLGNNDTKAEAIEKLSTVRSYMVGKLSPYYGVVGNHDTNYQGVETLSNSTIANLFFPGNGGKTYYEFDTGNTHFFALDSGIDTGAGSLRALETEQLKWIGQILENNQHDNLAILVHIIWYDAGTTLSAFATQISALVQAFNGGSTYTIDGETFDFSEASGKFRFIVAGHIHADKDTTFGDVPVIVTRNTLEGRFAFDLCAANYGTGKFNTIRVGYGSNREFTMPS